ncbi:MAG: acyl-[acyl-carrier-protein] thioesterase [Lachnospiraceae bacterium]|nr:acyl-[acyl-carrier-protein] thioesterase [Lachnospiraceae bacterium]
MYSFDTRIRYSECGVNKKLTLPALVNYFQDCSTFQSAETAGSWEALMEKDLVWMILFWEIEVSRYPAMYEEIKIGTIPYSIKGLFGNRNFFMEDAGGNMISKANSIWVLIDLKTQLPVRVPREVAAAYPAGEKLDMMYTGRKIIFPETGENRTAGELIARQRDLDINRHVNNEQYIRFATDALEEAGFGDRTHPERLRVEYRKQAFKGDMIYPLINDRTEDGKRIFTVSLNGEDKNPYCLVEITD